MYALATDTGGKALLDNNELSTGVVNAGGDFQLLHSGLLHQQRAMDGKYRRIKVTYNGDASAKLEFAAGILGRQDLGQVHHG